MLLRFWHRDRDRGWALLEQIAHNTVRFGLPDTGSIELLLAISVAIVSESHQDPDDLGRLLGIWRELSDRLLDSRLGRGARLLGRGPVLRALVAGLTYRLKRQPKYQPLNYAEMVASFARPADSRVLWRRVLTCLQDPATAPGPVVEVLGQRDLPFDLYLMLVCERALIYYGVHTDPVGVMDVAEDLFRTGAPWFRQSILYVLFHVLSAWESVDDSILDRYEALTVDFHRSGDWQLDTPQAHYVFANQLAHVDAIVARHGGGRAPHVVGDLLDSAIAAKDEKTIEALFDAIDGIAFHHADGALALTMLEGAYLAGGAMVEHRVIASLASVRLQDQPLVDAFLAQHISFARIRPDEVAAAEPSVGDKDFNTLVDKFFVQTMLSSEGFRIHFCEVMSAITTMRKADQALRLLVEWVRDELAGLTAPAVAE
jgi:hypothetical protein